MKNDKNKIPYFLYARKSSESEDRQVQSIEDQIKRLKVLANDLGLSIKEILTESKSAKKPHHRPVFADMLNRIEKGEAEGILCWQINRLSRNPVDSGTLGWMLQQGTLKSIQTIDKEYLPDDNVLLFNIETGQANQFIIDLKKNSMRGMEGKADRGWLPSRAPLGYLNDKIEHTIVVDPERFNLVRKMWDMMLTGNYTPPQIREIANKEWGFRTPKTKKDGGVEIANSLIYKMFTNIFYTGAFKWAGKIYTKGNHMPMVTLEEYDRVQFILGKKGKPRAQTHEFAYTSLMRCEVCGVLYTASEKQKIIKKTGELKTYVYYHHGNHRREDSKCNQKNPMTLKEVEDQIDAELERNTILPVFQKWALDILNRNNDKEIADRTKIYESQQKALADTQRELDNLTKMRYRELIDDETFVKERDGLKEKIAKLKEKIQGTESRAEKWLELSEKTFNFACYARKEFILGDLNKKREIFSALGQNFTVKDGKIHITHNEWFVPIEKAYPILLEEYKRVELDKNLDTATRKELTDLIILNWGGYWELNPDRELHKLACYRYTIATIYCPTYNLGQTLLYHFYG